MKASTALQAAAVDVVGSRAHEKNDLERRREAVAYFRFVLNLTEREIVARLARLNPPIITTRTTVSRDLQRQRATFRRYFSQRGFDPRSEVGVLVSELQHIIAKSFRDARRTRDSRDRALHRKIALDAIRELSTLYQDVGLVDKRDFLLPPDVDGQKVERLPTGDELQRFFQSVNVPESALVSEAELALRYGDQAATERHDDDREREEERTP